MLMPVPQSPSSSLAFLVQAMPPKLSAAQIDEKLEELHTFVRGHVALLASRNGLSLYGSLRQTASAEEKKWCNFLYKNAHVMTEAQQNHILQTYALLAEQRDPSLESCAAASPGASSA